MIVHEKHESVKKEKMVLTHKWALDHCLGHTAVQNIQGKCVQTIPVLDGWPLRRHAMETLWRREKNDVILLSKY